MEKKIGDILSEGLLFVPKIIQTTDNSSKATPIKKRLADSAVEILTDPAGIDDAMFHHSILCQTYLPYKDPGDQVTLWEQKQGNASLAIQTMKLKDPLTDEWVQMGCRMALAHG